MRRGALLAFCLTLASVAWSAPVQARNQLSTTGGVSYDDHAPVDGMCDRSSPSSFGHGVGDEYYLIVPNEATRDGGAGPDSSGNPRPPGSGDCGVQRIDSCG